MKVYIGGDGRKSTVQKMFKYGWGIMLTEYKTPTRFPYYALDNGVFGAWTRRQTWNPKPFLANLERFQNPAPDFTVVPDKVAKGNESLEYSLDWVNSVRMRNLKTRCYLAVQDGMVCSKVLKNLDKFDGLFVGGTMAWKHQTAPIWIDLAHKHNIPCHIGRVGSWKRILWAYNAGADSIDSTSWGRFDRFHDLARAKEQRQLGRDQSFR